MLRSQTASWWAMSSKASTGFAWPSPKFSSATQDMALAPHLPPSPAARISAGGSVGAEGLTANHPCVELHLRIKSGAGVVEQDEEITEALGEVAELEEADKEARLVALQLRELKARQHRVWDEATSCFRPLEWSDVAILLRSPANKSESYAKEFSRLQVPLQVARGGFYQSLEISDLLGLLQVLDNPLQDLPLLAVLHSPLVGLTLDELATIRLTVKGPFWTA